MAKLYEALATSLREWGVEAAFGLMGEETAWLTVALEANGIRYYATRHEATAVGMADGYSRSTGRVGVALISRGPGLTNALTAVISASKARSSVLVIVGEGDIGIPVRRDRSAFLTEEKYVDQELMLQSAGVPTTTVADANTLLADIRAYFDRAWEHMTLVVNLPMDLLSEQAGNAPTAVSVPAISRVTTPASPADIAVVADLLTSGSSVQRPVIIAGRGAVFADAHAALEALAERTGALLSTTLMAKSYFDGNSFDIGVSGVVGTHLAQRLITDADLIIAVGTSLDAYTTARGALLRGSTVIHVDAEPLWPAVAQPADYRIVGDARSTADALVAELEARGYAAVGYRSDEIAREIAEYDVTVEFTPVERDGFVDPRTLMMELETILPRERILVADDGHHWTWPAKYLSVPEPSAFMFPIEYFAVGSATGLALGAAVGRPDRLVVFCVGDGGMMMTLADIDTAVRYNLNMLTFVTNDEGFGAEVHFLNLTGFPADVARCASPSFAAIASAVGANGHTITNQDGVKDVGSLLDRGVPAVVDCRVLPDLRAEWIDFHFEHAP